jgi:hypothetical protein
MPAFYRRGGIGDWIAAGSEYLASTGFVHVAAPCVWNRAFGDKPHQLVAALNEPRVPSRPFKLETRRHSLFPNRGV